MLWEATLEGHCGQVAVLSASIDACRRAGYWEVSYPDRWEFGRKSRGVVLKSYFWEAKELE